MDLTRAIESRRSIRKFKSKNPDWRDIIECIDATRYAPSAGGYNILKIILVDDLEKIKKIAKAAEQDFIAQTQYVVVICSDTPRLTNSYGKKGEIYARQQAGAAIQNFLLKLEEKKLSTCWIGHFLESSIKKILDIPDEVDVEALFPIGYEFEKKYSRKAQKNLDSMLYFNCYGQRKIRERNKIDV